MTTSIPKDCNCLAAANPEIPAPITTTRPNFLTGIQNHEIYFDRTLHYFTHVKDILLVLEM